MLAERFDDLSDLYWDSLFGRNWLGLTPTVWKQSLGGRPPMLLGVSVSFEELSDADTQTHTRGLDQTFSSFFNFNPSDLCTDPLGRNSYIRLAGAAQDYETCSSFDGCDRFVVAWRQNNPSHRPLHLSVVNCYLILQAIYQDKSTTMCLKDGFWNFSGCFWHLVVSGQFTNIQSVGMFGLDLIYIV